MAYAFNPFTGNFDITGNVTVTGGLTYQGVWNASTNTPAIPAAAPANKNQYYIVSVKGTTTVDGISAWDVGDWIISNGVAWQKLVGADAGINSVGAGLGLSAAGVLSLGDGSGVTYDSTNRSLTLTGATVTTSKPVLDLSQEWGAAGVTFTGLKFNASGSSNTNSAAGSRIADYQVGGVTKAYLDKTGKTWTTSLEIGTFGPISAVSNNILNFYNNQFSFDANGGVAALILTSAGTFGFSSGVAGAAASMDVRLTRGGPATLQLGAADVASGAVAQTLQVQSNTGAQDGPNFTIKGSTSGAANVGGSIILQTARAGTYYNALSLGTTNSPGPSATVGANGKLLVGASFLLDDFLGRFLVYSGGHIAFASGLLSINSTTYDLALWRDAAGILALKNSTNPQIFRVYSTTTGPNYGYIGAGVTDAGVATADTLFIGTGGAGGAMTKLGISLNGRTESYFVGGGLVLGSGSVNNGGISLVSVNDVNSAFAYITMHPNTGTGSFSSRIQFLPTSINFQDRNQPNNGYYMSVVPSSWQITYHPNGADLNLIGQNPSTNVLTLGNATTTSVTTSAPITCGNTTGGGTALNVTGTGGASLMSVVNTTSGDLFSVVNSSAATVFKVTDTGATTIAGNVAVGAGVTISNAGGSITLTSDGSNNLNTSSNWGIGTYGQIKVSSAGYLAFGNAFSGYTLDTYLYRDGAGIFAQKNADAAQRLRIYSATTGSNYAYIGAGTTDAGVATADTLFIGTASTSGTAMSKLAFVVNGTTRLNYGANSSFTTSLEANALQFHVYGGFGSTATKGGFLVGSDNGAFLGGNVSWNGANWVARDTAASLLTFGNGGIAFATDAGLTAGNTYTPTSRITISTAGLITLNDASDIAVGSTTGTKIGTATTQKIGFWNATPIVQPTTGVTAATVASTGTGDVVAASTTFDGYTIGQVVKALRNAGLLA